MKKTIFPILIALFAIATMSTSCSKTCGEGYEGSNCTAVSAKFVGAYAGTATVTANGNTSAPSADTLLVTTGVNPSAILLTGNTSQVSLGATVSGYNFTVPAQQVNINGTQVSITSGGGTLNGNVLSGTYTGTSGGVAFTATFSDVKQ